MASKTELMRMTCQEGHLDTLIVEAVRGKTYARARFTIESSPSGCRSSVEISRGQLLDLLKAFEDELGDR